MILMLIYAALVFSCKVGQVQHKEDCVDICNNMFFNNDTQICEPYKECQAGEYLELDGNYCVNECMNGYYESGVCVCYAGWKKNKNDECVYDNNYNDDNDYTLGLDWFYWGCIFIVVANAIYLVICYFKYRKRTRKKLEV